MFCVEYCDVMSAESKVLRALYKTQSVPLSISISLRGSMKEAMPSLRRCKAKFKYKMIEKEKQIEEFLGMKVRHQFAYCAFHQLLFCLIYGDTFKCIWESSKVKIFDDALWVLVLLHTPAFTKQRGANSKIWWAHEIQF